MMMVSRRACWCLCLSRRGSCADARNPVPQVFYAFAMVLICWVLWGYKVAFGNYMLPIAVVPNTVTRMSDELQQSALPSAGLTQNFPQATMV